MEVHSAHLQVFAADGSTSLVVLLRRFEPLHSDTCARLGSSANVGLDLFERPRGGPQHVILYKSNRQLRVAPSGIASPIIGALAKMHCEK